ncbi:MAG: sulfurtransferase [Pirellulales bacterium]
MTTDQDGQRRSMHLVETDWLERNLDAPDLRIFDCTVTARPNPEADARSPILSETGRAGFDDGHIPGAGFLDLISDLSDPSGMLAFMAPPRERFAGAMGDVGVSDGKQVVLYSATEPIWATRVWWLLRAFGFTGAAILDGGWGKWTAEQRPVSTEPCAYEPTQFLARPTAGCFVDQEAMLAAVGDERVSIVNALPAPVFAGTGGPVFGRKGRVAGSVSIPFASLHDQDTGTYLGPEKLRAAFAAVDVDSSERIMAYCGSGVAATNDAFALVMLGHENVAVYDASMSEWGHDASLPMESD